VICISGFFGLKAFVTAIQDQRTCEWANIDNIELHAHVDIPSVSKSDCDYDKEHKTKRAFFTIDKNKVDLDEYIQTNSLKKLSLTAEPEYDRFLKLRKDSLRSAELYYKNASDRDRGDVLLDKNTGRLWVTIKYKD
jgi:hypothetical protein